ncbi:MAG: hypothetical protein K2X77_31355 [Candidatus Obscuribacterales bacterium]|jgi:tetratricopeptide (TPR) repeat protein|nr:hypothetical protein [Candidatus Obscuribacterales bacterium]
MENEQTMQQTGCKHPEVQLRVGSPEFEFFVAKSILEAGGDLRHGANHVSNLLTFDPGNPEWVSLLERYLSAAQPDPESLIPKTEDLYFSTEAVRAYIWFRTGRLDEAFDLLFDVVHAKPDSHYLNAWALPWLEQKGVLENISDIIGWCIFSLVLHTNPEAKNSTIKGLRNLERWAKLINKFDSLHPTTETRANTLRVGLLRKAGMFDDAQAAARQYMARDKSWNMAAALGLVLKAKGDVNAALGAFKTAMTVPEGEMVAKTEIGDMFFDQQDYKTALAWYEDILRMQADHEWALPSSLFCKFKLSMNEAFLDEMAKLGEKNNERAHELFFKEFGGLPRPTDAMANMIAQIAGQVMQDPTQAPKGVIKFKTSSVEAPSNFLAFNMDMKALKHDLKMEVTPTDIPRPDPRFPVIPKVKYILWKYKDKTPEPALPAPSQKTSMLIATITNTFYEEHKNWAAASWIAAELGPKMVPEILACMVHPPQMPENWNGLIWVPRVQLACAQVLANIDEGWDGSERKEALLSLLYGPCDWTTQAAIRAMAYLAKEQEVYSPKIGEAFEKLSKYRPSFGFCCWEHTLYACWIRLPHLFPSERNAMKDRLREIEERMESS